MTVSFRVAESCIEVVLSEGGSNCIHSATIHQQQHLTLILRANELF